MLFASRTRTRGFKVFKDVEEPDDEFIRPLLLKHPNTFRGWREVNEMANNGNGAVSSSGRQTKAAGIHPATQKKRNKRAKRIISVIGRAIGSALIPDLREPQRNQCKKTAANVQLAYPPFMFSAGVFMFAF